MIRTHAAAAPALFVVGLCVAFGGTLLGGEHHGGHQLLLVGPVAVGGALAFRARAAREWWTALGATGIGTLAGAIVLAMGA